MLLEKFGKVGTVILFTGAGIALAGVCFYFIMPLTAFILVGVGLACITAACLYGLGIWAFNKLTGRVHEKGLAGLLPDFALDLMGKNNDKDPSMTPKVKQAKGLSSDELDSASDIDFNCSVNESDARHSVDSKNDDGVELTEQLLNINT